MPQRPIIILDQQQSAPPIYRFLLRADVPAARQPFYAVAGYKSPFVPLSPDTDPDAAALVSGAVVEKMDTLQMIAGTTLAQIEAELVTRQTAYQASVTADTKWSRYGSFFNGSAWIGAGV